ncbi:MAG: hypothetical protein OHK005_05810 [Candidatus Methylacidiphilales bacterium]
MKHASKAIGHSAFTLVEMLVVLAIVGILVGLGTAAVPRILGLGDRTDSVQRLRGLGQAMAMYAADHGDRFPGPLWPGQVPEYDPNREGRLVQELADYLGIERPESRMVVESFIPRGIKREMAGRNLAQVRVYVVRIDWEVMGVNVRPFGLLTGTRQEPESRGSLAGLDGSANWMIAEADQKHPNVAGAPWRGFTVREPLHDGNRAVLMLDGSVHMEPSP